MPNEENDEPIVESLNFEKPDFVFEPKQYHEWRQQGYYLICKSCDIEHAVWIGSKRLMVGINEEGQPIFKDRTES